jgi:hypothetical protein
MLFFGCFSSAFAFHTGRRNTITRRLAGAGQRAAIHTRLRRYLPVRRRHGADTFGIGRDEALAYILVAQALGSLLMLAFGLPGLYRLQGAKHGLR